MVQVLYWQRHRPRADVCPVHHPSYTCPHRTRYVGEFNVHFALYPLLPSESSFLCALNYHVRQNNHGNLTTVDSHPALVYPRSRIEF